MTSFADLNIPPIVVNGSDLVGIAVQGDMRIPVDQRLRVPVASSNVVVSDQHRVALAVSGCTWAHGTERTDLLDTALALVAVREYYGRWDAPVAGEHYDGDVVEVPDVDVDQIVLNPVQLARSTRAAASLGNASLVNAAHLLIASTKINWYQTNHHTGQGAIQGYAAKVARFILGADPTAEFVAAMHRVGHWCSTLSVLHGLVSHVPGAVPGLEHAIVGLSDGPSFRHAFPRAAADALLRVSSAPAGAARLSTVHAALTRAARTPFAAAFGGIGGLPAVGIEYKAMRERTAEWHVGAQYLTGRAKIDASSVTDEIVAAASLFVHVTMPGSSLSRARVLMSQVEAAAVVPGVAQTLVSLRAAMALGPTSNDDIVHIAEHSAQVINANPLASLVPEGEAFDVAAAMAQ